MPPHIPVALRDSVLVAANASRPDKSSVFHPCLSGPSDFFSTGTLDEEVDKDDPRFLDDAGAPGSEAEESLF